MTLMQELNHFSSVVVICWVFGKTKTVTGSWQINIQNFADSC